MSLKLRELIKSVRVCKTAAEERAAVAKECASIRDYIKTEEAEYRPRNVAKLLYIHMLGYPTHFGQMECMKLIVSSQYSDKRIGYLGLMTLLDEKQEVLMLVTNSLRNDLNHNNQYVVGLALCALGNIGSTSIARDTAPDVEKLMQNTNPYIRKKAALCALRIIRKVPELSESFVPRVRSLLGDRNHGVLLTSLSLMIELAELSPAIVDNFRKLVPTLIKVMKNLMMSYSPEYDVGGVVDPFLQSKILRLLRTLGRGDRESSDLMNDLLAQVATNTEGLRNVGNAILYECVQTIMEVESDNNLRILAITILGRFLVNRDNNIRYVALNTLTTVAGLDKQIIQRHRNTIVECLQDADISIRRRALELTYLLVDSNNCQSLVKELIQFLQQSDKEFRPEQTAKLCLVTERYAPNKKWHIKTILKIMNIAGNLVPDETVSNLIALIGNNPEIQYYAASKMYKALNRSPPWDEKTGLVVSSVWCLGEYGDVLFSPPSDDSTPVSISGEDLVDVLERLLNSQELSEVCKPYILTALFKLTQRLSSQLATQRCRTIIESHVRNVNVEIQQRSVEYKAVLSVHDPQLAAVLVEKMPVLEFKERTEEPKNLRASQSSSDPARNAPTKAPEPLIDGVVQNPTSPIPGQIVPASGPDDIFGAIFGGGGISSTNPQPLIAPSTGTSGIDDLLGLNISSPSPVGGYGVGSVPLTNHNLMMGNPMRQNPLDFFSTPSPTPLASTSSPSLTSGPIPALNNHLINPTASPLDLFSTPSPVAYQPNPFFPAGPATSAPLVSTLAPVTPLSPSLTPSVLQPASSVAPLTPSPSPLTPIAASTPGVFPPSTIFDKDGLKIVFEYSKPTGQGANPSMTTINITFSNSSPKALDNFVFQAAVPKYVKIQLSPPSATTVPANNSGKVTQVAKLINTLHGQKPLLMKTKIDYSVDGVARLEQTVVSEFPAGL